MCFRRYRRSNFYSRCAFDVIDGIIFTPGMLFTLSTKQFSLPMCFRRCRRGNFHSRRAIRSPFWTFFTLWVWFHRLFRIFEGLSPPSSPPPHGCCRGGGGERISKTEVRPRGWGLFPPRLRRRNIRLWRRPR